jgi:hypothetical protein
MSIFQKGTPRVEIFIHHYLWTSGLFLTDFLPFIINTWKLHDYPSYSSGAMRDYAVAYFEFYDCYHEWFEEW